MSTALRLLKALWRLAAHVAYATANVVYKTVTRTALYLATAYLALYFLLNSTAFKDTLMTELGGLLPGRFAIENLQWGPSPGDITLLGTTIYDPTITPVIRVDRLSTTIDLLALWGFGIRKSVSPASTPLELRFNEVHIRGAEVLVEVTDSGWVGIAAAFDDPNSPSGKPGAGTHIEINNIALERVEVQVKVPGVRVNGEDIDIRGGRVMIVNSRVRATAPRLKAFSGEVIVDGAAPNDLPLRLPWAQVESTRALWDDGLLVIDRATLIGSRTPIEVTGRLDTRGERVTVDATAKLRGLTDKDPLVSLWTGDRLSLDADLTLTASGPFSWPHARAKLRARRLTALGINLGPIDLGLTLKTDSFQPTASLDPVSFVLGAGVLHIDHASVTLPPTGLALQRFALDLRLQDIFPTALWDLGLLNPRTLSVPSIATGRLNGPLRIRADRLLGAKDPTWDLTGTLALFLDWAADPSLPLGTSLSLIGQVRAVLGTAADYVQARPLHLQSNANTADLTGRLALPGLQLNLALDAALNIEALLAPYGRFDLRCALRLQDGWLTGSVASPNLSATLGGDRCHAYGIDLRKIRTALALKDGALTLAHLNADTGWGSLQTRAALTLWGTGWDDLSPTFPLTLTKLDASGLDLARLKLLDLAGVAHLRASRLSFPLVDPIKAVGAGTLQITGLRIGGERFGHFDARLSATSRRVKVERLTARATNGATLKAKGSLVRATGALSGVEITASAINLRALNVLSRYQLPARGTVDLKLHADGRLDRLAVGGRLRLRRFGWADYTLGDATLNFERPAGQRLVSLHSPRFFRGMTLTRGLIELSPRAIPTRLLVDAALKDLEVTELMPSLRKNVSSVLIRRGNGSFDLHFDDTPLQIGADLPDSALTLSVPGFEPIHNVGRLQGTLVGPVAHIDRFIAQYQDHRLGLCGWFDLQKSTLAVDIGGGVDLAKVTQLTDTVSDASGRVVTWRKGGTPTRPFEGSCLSALQTPRTLRQLGSPHGYLQLRNTLQDPTITGGLRFQKVAMTPRSLGREVAIDDGIIRLQPSGGGHGIELVIDPKQPLQGSFVDGRFRVFGRARLPNVSSRTTAQSWTPDVGDLRIVGREIEWSAPREYSVTFDPEIALSFKGLATSDSPAVTIKGDLDIVEGLYQKSFSFLAKAVGNALGGRIQEYEESIFETWPWLRNTVLDIKVRGGNFMVQSDLAVARTDVETRMDLRTTGTLGDIKLRGNVEIVDGTITYTVVRRLFEVTRGLISFDGDPGRARIDLEAETVFDNINDDRVVRHGDDVVVAVVVTGRLPDPNVQFIAPGANLSKLEIQRLILTGGLAGAAAGGAGSSVELLSYNLVNLLEQVIKAPFVDIKLSPTDTGETQVETILRLGQAARLNVTSRAGGKYDARFRHRFTDRWELEATRKAPQDDTQDRERYEVRMKYTVPLD